MILIYVWIDLFQLIQEHIEPIDIQMATFIDVAVQLWQHSFVRVEQNGHNIGVDMAIGQRRQEIISDEETQ